MFERSILILKFDQFLLIPFKDIDFILKVSDNDFLLVGLDLERRVEVRRSFGVTHQLTLLLKNIKIIPSIIRHQNYLTKVKIKESLGIRGRRRIDA